jgi:hypothetical protein
MRRLLPLLALIIVISACSTTRSSAIFDPHDGKVRDNSRKEIAAEIAKLAQGKDVNDDEGVANHSDAVMKLSSRGAVVEPQMIETLNGSDDWSMRLGAIEVLESVGGRNCVDALIEALNDKHPLVARRAEVLLSNLCDHKVIPEAGQPVSAEGVPPIPRRDPNQLALDTEEKIWNAWYKDNSLALQQAWSTWWKNNKKTVTIH